MKIFLNITNPVYVSSSDIPCELSVRVTNRFLFQSIETNVTVKENFTVTSGMPSMLNTNDADRLMSIGESTKNSMMFTLAIPFIFMVFMSISMNKVWSMYLML